MSPTESQLRAASEMEAALSHLDLEPGKGPPPGNKNAAKPEDEHLSSRVIIACHPTEKSSWIQAAFPGKLSEWVRSELNCAAIATKPELADKLADILVKRSDAKKD